MENPEQKTQTDQTPEVDLAKFASTGQAEQPAAAPPPNPDFSEETFANMVAEIAASVMASDLPIEAYALLPSPKYLAEFYKIIQLRKASGYLYGAVNPDPKTILLIGGIGTAAYMGLMFFKTQQIKKQLGIAGTKKAGAERKAEWERVAREMQEQAQKQQEEQNETPEP